MTGYLRKQKYRSTSNFCSSLVRCPKARNK